MTLYEITGELLELQNMIECGIDDETVRDTLESVSFDFESKAEDYVKVIRNLESEVKALKDEETRLKEKRWTIENGIKRMRYRLQSAMDSVGKKKLSAGVFSLAIQKNGGAVPVILDTDVAMLPEECLKLDIEPNLKKLREYLMDEQTAEYYKQFAHLGDRGESLRIK